MRAFSSAQGHWQNISREGSSNKLIVEFVDMILTQRQYSARPLTSIPTSQIFSLQKANISLWVFAKKSWALFQCKSSSRLKIGDFLSKFGNRVRLTNFTTDRFQYLLSRSIKIYIFFSWSAQKAINGILVDGLWGLFHHLCIDNCKVVASSVNIHIPVQRWKFKEGSKHST